MTDDSAHTQMLKQHLGLVVHVAAAVRNHTENNELDELTSMGVLGLIDALKHYNPEKNIKFSTYAVPRIRGAILDGLRRTDHVSRGTRRRARLIRNAYVVLSARLMRGPTELEVAELLDITVPVLRNWKVAVNGVNTAPWQKCRLPQDDQDPLEDETHAERARILAREILKLNDKERTVLTLYYHAQMRMVEVAETMNITGSRVSQLHAAALKKLRKALPTAGIHGR